MELKLPYKINLKGQPRILALFLCLTPILFYSYLSNVLAINSG